MSHWNKKSYDTGTSVTQEVFLVCDIENVELENYSMVMHTTMSHSGRSSPQFSETPSWNAHWLESATI
jgi:hypothetical protein